MSPVPELSPSPPLPSPIVPWWKPHSKGSILVLKNLEEKYENERLNHLHCLFALFYDENLSHRDGWNKCKQGYPLSTGRGVGSDILQLLNYKIFKKKTSFLEFFINIIDRMAIRSERLPSPIASSDADTPSPTRCFFLLFLSHLKGEANSPITIIIMTTISSPSWFVWSQLDDGAQYSYIDCNDQSCKSK